MCHSEPIQPLPITSRQMSALARIIRPIVCGMVRPSDRRDAAPVQAEMQRLNAGFSVSPPSLTFQPSDNLPDLLGDGSEAKKGPHAPSPPTRGKRCNVRVDPFRGLVAVLVVVPDPKPFEKCLGHCAFEGFDYCCINCQRWAGLLARVPDIHSVNEPRWVSVS